MGLVGERDLVFVLNIAVTITTLIPVFWGSIPMRHYGSFDGYQVLLLIGYLGLFVGWGVLRANHHVMAGACSVGRNLWTRSVVRYNY
jgi:hypothetical protein